MHNEITLVHLLTIIGYLICTITAVPAAGAPAPPLVRNYLSGGEDGKPFKLYANRAGSPVNEFDVWWARLDGRALYALPESPFIICGLKVGFADGSSAQVGVVDRNDGRHDFAGRYLEGFKVMEASIGAGEAVDSIYFWVEGTAGIPLTISAGGGGGTQYPQDVGSGVLVGFEGTVNDDRLVSLGMTFLAY